MVWHLPVACSADEVLHRLDCVIGIGNNDKWVFRGHADHGEIIDRSVGKSCIQGGSCRMTARDSDEREAIVWGARHLCSRDRS